MIYGTGQQPSPEVAPADDKHVAAFARAEELRIAGNDHMAKGNFADATKSYQDGLLAVVAVGGAEVPRAASVRLALHLNASLAELRRGNLGASADHASGALAIEPTSAKALYRRGLARWRLSEHTENDAEASAGLADLERALELEPSNAEVRKHVKECRAKVRSERKELDKSQKTQFEGIFKSATPLYKETAPKERPPAPRIISEDHPLALSAEHVTFHYERNAPVLKDLTLDLREGWCVGLVGNNATGKSTLARLMVGKLWPVSGRLLHHRAGGDGDGEERSGTAWQRGRWAVPLVAVPLVAVLAAVAFDPNAARVWLQRLMWWQWVAMVCCLLFVFAWVAWSCRPGAAAGTKRKRTVLHVSSETSDKEDIPDKKTIEAVISEKMSRRLSKDEKRGFVVALLRAGGFQMYNQETGEALGTPEEYVRDGLRFGVLSGGQRHLIYLLRCFASRPEVLLCDEALGGLDAIRQPRVLRMLQRLKTDGDTAILYIGCELHQIRLVADSLAFLTDCTIVEHGRTLDVLDSPSHPATKDYVGLYRTLPGCTNIGGKLAEAYTGLAGDVALAAAWLPPRP